jgi:aquaporin Z
MHIKNYIAEVLGTFMLVFFGTGAAVFAGTNEGIGKLGIALAFGLAIIAAAYSVGKYSGAHLNPAVSLAMFIDKRLSGLDLVGYIVGQLVGATLASFVMSFLAPAMGLESDKLGQTTFDTLTSGEAFITELLLTFIFVFVILHVTEGENSDKAGIVIGLTLTMSIFVGINLTGAGLNPARSFGPAVFAGGEALSQLWVYILAPLVGGALAALAKIGFSKEETAEEK